jgi:hypothetical protein
MITYRSVRGLRHLVLTYLLLLGMILLLVSSLQMRRLSLFPLALFR